MSAVDILALDGSLLSNEQPQPLPLERAGFSRIPEVYDILIHISLLCMIIVHSQSLSVSDGYISYYIYIYISTQFLACAPQAMFHFDMACLQ